MKKTFERQCVTSSSNSTGRSRVWRGWTGRNPPGQAWGGAGRDGAGDLDDPVLEDEEEEAGGGTSTLRREAAVKYPLTSVGVSEESVQSSELATASNSENTSSCWVTK